VGGRVCMCEMRRPLGYLEGLCSVVDTSCY
jgi:hypothetical protein